MFKITRSLSRINGMKFHTSCIKRIDVRDVEEVKIPVPWGHIAGKWWGSKDKQPILAIHGWQDNAGSWDPFASTLTDEYSLLAIDLPGNGLSSHLPPMQNYYFIDSVPLLKRIKNHYGFEQFHLLGHSGGSAACFLFSSIYPEDVSSYFGIDYITYAYKNEDKRVENMGKLIDKKLVLAERDIKNSKDYTWDEAKNTWINGTVGSVSPTSAEILMKRGVHKNIANGKVIFSRDQRLKGGDLFLINQSQLYEISKNLKCHVKLIKASKSKLFDSGLKNLPDLLDILKKNAKSFEITTLNEKHHLHMDIPETISELYVNFRKKIGKWWGDQKTRPILAAHGLYDNAGTFDRLIPKLDVQSVLCLDLPGHGLSSHLPIPGKLFDYVSIIRFLIKNHFKWDKLTCLGHSYGSCIFFLYAGCYPDEIDTMISLDCASFHNIYKSQKYIFDMRKTTEDIIKPQKNSEIDSISFDECLEQMYNKRVSINFPLSHESCKILLKRGVINTGGHKYKFSQDLSTKITTLGRITYPLYEALSINIKCNLLNLSVMDGGFNHRGYLEAREKHVKSLEKNAKKVKHAIIKGGHHAHLEHPDIVAPIINDFIK